jgi:copper chaperone CopZ
MDGGYPSDTHCPGDDDTMGFFKKKEQGTPVDLKVTGMTCPHCEMRVRNALKGVPGVTEAKADHEGDKATAYVDGDVPMDALVNAVTEAGYTVES